MKIGANIRKARRDLDLTMKEVAEELETTQQTVSNIEKKFDSKTYQYLIYLRKKGVDINKIFESTI